MSFILFLIIFFLIVGVSGVSIVLSLLGKGVRGILSIFGLGNGNDRIEKERPSWKKDIQRNNEEEDTKLEIRTEDGLRRIKKMKDSAETIEYEEVKNNNEQ